MSRLNPLARMLISFCFIAATGLTNTFPQLATLLVCYLLLGVFCGLTPLKAVAVLRPFLFFFIFTLLIQLFVSADGHWSRPTNETTIYAVFYVSKFAMVVGFSLLFVRTTPASDIVKIFYLLFQPLKYFRISPLDAAFSVLVTLRFIPLLFNEGGKIMDVQRLKGILPLKGESLPLLRTVRVVSALITPLLVRTFRYASQIAIALRYRTGNPSFFALAAFNWFDFVAISIAIVISAGAKLALS